MLCDKLYFVKLQILKNSPVFVPHWHIYGHVYIENDITGREIANKTVIV